MSACHFTTTFNLIILYNTSFFSNKKANKSSSTVVKYDFRIAVHISNNVTSGHRKDTLILHWIQHCRRILDTENSESLPENTAGWRT